MRLGDMIRDIRNPNLSKQRLDDIVRQLNELGDREERYTASLSAIGGIRLNNPVILDPDFHTSPLRVFHAYFTTTDPVANDTHEKVTFESSGGDKTTFDFFNNDKSQIRLDRSQFGVRLDGMVTWAANGTGYRNLQLRIFDGAGVSLGSLDLHNLPAATGVKTVLPISYTENIRDIFNNVIYMEFWVRQNSGAPLDLDNFVLSVSIA